ncbi:MAG: LptA/OstA family protein [Erythrobacter sp.]
MNRSLASTALRSSALGFALTLAIAGGIGLHAQGLGGHDSNARVDFRAEGLDIDDRQNRAVLSGGVVVNQAGLTVRAQRMLVDYSDAERLSISRITATGGVNVARGGETASGDAAVYDLERRIITLAGNVELRRGGDRLSGGRLVIDLASGRASVDGRGASGGQSTGGQVSGSFNVPQRRGNSSNPEER